MNGHNYRRVDLTEHYDNDGCNLMLPKSTAMTDEIEKIQIIEAGDVGDFKTTLGEMHPEALQAIQAIIDRSVAEARIDELEAIKAEQLPWPEDIFGKVEEDDWPKLNDFAKQELGYPIDRISGDLMRHGWRCYIRVVNDRIATLTEQGEPK